ncbi:MAG TPA: ABC transporter ATP-binding protein [Gemmataceae bacterium]|nr:ABC transporter ATP-binding protein [Gemmataceae bacterium]
MTGELTADLDRQWPKGPRIQVQVKVPTDRFSITVLFGPSGSGKTTVLRCLAGLDRPERGSIRFEDEIWFDAARNICLSPQRRRIGYLSQDYALFPHLTVAQNIAFGLGGLDAAQRQQRIEKMLQLLHLAGLEQRWPRQLSGGEQQRVALARAVARQPRLLLLDEPLSALDAPTRERLRGDLRRLLAGLGIPAVLVTHDRVEALALGDSAVLLDRGRVCQSGPVHELFAHPANLAAARITGVDTVEPAKVLAVVDGLATLAVGSARLVALAPDATAGEGYISIRAEDVILEKGPGAPSSARNCVTGHIRTLTREGPLVRIGLDCGFDLTALITNQACLALELREGDQVTALVKAAAIQLIPRD